MRNHLLAVLALFVFSTIIIASNLDDKSLYSSPLFKEGVESSLTFNMDSCSAWILAGTRNEYNEFTAEYNLDPECSGLDIINGYLYRDNPTTNFHSCTPGLNGTAALCISSDDACTYDAGNEKSLKIDIEITPGPSGTAALSEISFYERAPEMFQFLNGPSGLNNYPTLFGVRILNDGQEVYRIEDIATNLDWTQHVIDLDSVAALTVDTTTVFNIEMMAYCLIDNAGTNTAWDLEDITINSICIADDIEGGSLTTKTGETEVSICAQDGESDLIDFTITGNTGDQSAWIITDLAGNILDLPISTPIDFEGLLLDACLVWHLSYEGPITGLEVGLNASGITGCFALSNSVLVNKNAPNGGVLTTKDGRTSVAVCAGDELEGPIEVTIQGATGSNFAWVITDEFGNILDLPNGPPFDYDDPTLDTYLIWYLSYDGVISGAEIGNNASELSGCFALSNPITVSKDALEGGTISLISGATDTMICIGDGISDAFNVISSGASGSNSTWLITDESLNILEISNGPPFDFENSTLATCLIWHLTYNEVEGVGVGENASLITGCFALSNSIAVYRSSVNGGFISVNGEILIDICEDDGMSNVLTISSINEVGTQSKLILTDLDGNIIGFPTSYDINFDNRPSGTYIIYNVLYNTSLTGLDLGGNISDVTGNCYSFSNSITVRKERAEGGFITTPDGNDIMLCITDGVADSIDVSLTDSNGDFSTWLILDADGNILSIEAAPPFLPSFSNKECFIRHLSYGTSFAGLGVDQNIDNFLGCYDLSNEIKISKDSISGGYLSSDGSDFVFFCSLIGEEGMIEYQLVNEFGTNQDLILTDTMGTILEIITTGIIDLSSYPSGTYFVYNLAYNHPVINNIPGKNISDIDGICFDFSNQLEILKKAIDGGVIETPLGDDIVLCKSGSDALYDEVDISVVDLVGTNTAIIITDESGTILDLPVDLPLDLNGLGVNPCFVWHISYEVGLIGKEVGNNIADIEGCFDFSNSIRIQKVTVDGGEISFGDTSIVEVCVGDGIDDLVNAEVSGELGPESAWIIVDDQGIIQDVPSVLPYNFEESDEGVCYLYNLRFSGSIQGLMIGEPLDSLAGCIHLSNRITVLKYGIGDSEILFSDSTRVQTICVGDGVNDVLTVITVREGKGTAQIVVTDTNGNILGLPSGNSINFESAGGGTCLVWQLNYNGTLTGLEVGNNVANLEGCYMFSNSIEVIREEVISSEISLISGSTDTTICVGTGLSHIINAKLTSTGNGDILWLLTDASANILAVSPTPSFDFSNADEGDCFIWVVNYLGILEGAVAGNNVSVLKGCYALSNSIRVTRFGVDSPMLTFENGSLDKTICLSDDVDQTITPSVSNTEGEGQWVITDDMGVILALPDALPLDFNNAPTGVCFIWYVNYYGELEGAEVGESALNLRGCFKLSNAIVLNRIAFEPEDSNSSLCFDMEDCNAIIISGDNQDYSEFTADIDNDPACSQLTVIGDHLYRENPEVNLHSCAPGANNTIGMCVSALNDCDFEADSELALRFDIEVAPGSNNFGNISKLTFFERAPKDYVWINGNSGTNNYPLRYGIRVLRNGEEIYREEDIQTTTEYTLEEFDFSDLPEFTVFETTTFQFELLSYCLIGSNGLVEIWDVDEIKLYSNCTSAITGGTLTAIDGSLEDEVCVDDGEDDMLEVILTGAQGPNMAWIVTDLNGVILQLPTGPTFDFEGTAESQCLLWSISYINGLSGLQIGMNANDLEGCFALSNPLTITRKRGEDCENCEITGGQITFEDGSTNINICTDDSEDDDISFEVSGATGSSSAWVITDTDANIIEILSTNSFNFEGMAMQEYLIWHLTFDGLLQNAAVGNNASELQGCFALSNSISVIAETIAGGGCASAQNPTEESFLISPNPVNEMLTITTELEPHIDGSIQIFNHLGQAVISQEMIHRKKDIPTAVLPQGTYYIQINYKHLRIIKPFVKI